MDFSNASSCLTACRQDATVFYHFHSGGAVAQLGARLDGIEEVGGSNPPGSTKKNERVLQQKDHL